METPPHGNEPKKTETSPKWNLLRKGQGREVEEEGRVVMEGEGRELLEDWQIKK